MSKPGRMWLPLDASFTEDPRILRAGEPAAWLYLAILGKIKRTGAPGVITRDEVNVLPVRGIDRRLAALVDAGLVEWVPKSGDMLRVPAWDGWQSDSERAAYMRGYRARKRGDDSENGTEPRDEP